MTEYCIISELTRMQNAKWVLRAYHVHSILVQWTVKLLKCKNLRRTCCPFSFCFSSYWFKCWFWAGCLDGNNKLHLHLVWDRFWLNIWNRKGKHNLMQITFCKYSSGHLSSKRAQNGKKICPLIQRATHFCNTIKGGSSVFTDTLVPLLQFSNSPDYFLQSLAVY